MTPALRSLALSPDDTGFFVGLADGRVYAAGAADRPYRRLVGLEGEVTHLSVSPDGALLMAAGAPGVAVWDVASGRLLELLPHPTRVRWTVVVAPGRYALADEAGIVRIWTAGAPGDGADTSIPADGPLRSLAAGRQGEALLWVAGVALSIWNVAERRVEERVPMLTASAMASVDGVLALSPGGESILVYWDEWAVVSLRSREAVTELPSQGDSDCGAVTDAGDLSVIGSTTGSLWVARAGEGEVATYPVTEGALRALALSPSGKRAAFADEHGDGGVFDLEAGRVIVGGDEIRRRIGEAVTPGA
jgi:hypothetical protein